MKVYLDDEKKSVDPRLHLKRVRLIDGNQWFAGFRFPLPSKNVSVRVECNH